MKWFLQDYCKNIITYGLGYKKFINKDGITVEKYDGFEFYHINFNPHRLDGPAIKRPDGTLEWWYHGRKIPCNSQERFESIITKLGIFL
jgi:hypothetical protein